MLEETGIDVQIGEVAQINISTGEHEKTLRDNGERVFVKMVFYDYRVQLRDDAGLITVVAEDDWAEPRWFTADELIRQNVGAPTRRTLQKIGFLVD
jgi:8-oxo-dGTP pyrophosphatase MutT (NUDIX family)